MLVLCWENPFIIMILKFPLIQLIFGYELKLLKESYLYQLITFF